MNWMRYNRGFRKLMNTDDGGGSGDAGTGDAGTSGGKQDGNGDGGDAGEGKPFATFPDEKSFTSRVQREARKAQEATARELGFDSVEAMQEAAKAQREAQEKAKSEADRLKAEKEAAERKAAEATTRANQRTIRAEAKAQAAQMGVKADRLDYALRLADLSGVEVDDNGEPDVDAIKKAIGKVLEDLPELKGDQAPGKSGSEFNGSGKPPSDDNLRKAMGL